MSQRNFGLIVLIVMSLSSCSKEKVAPYNPPENLKTLIAGDSVKVWKLSRRYNGKSRMNMGDCFLAYRQIFREDGTVTDTNGNHENCGKSLSGSWQIIKDSLGYTHIRIESDLIPELMNIEENYKDFRIFYIDKDSLHISFEHTQFGEKRRISDYLVQENINVVGRNFHH